MHDKHSHVRYLAAKFEPLMLNGLGVTVTFSWPRPFSQNPEKVVELSTIASIFRFECIYVGEKRESDYGEIA